MKVKISAVSYLNTLPFLYGIKNHSALKNYVFEQDVPSVCAKKLIKNEVDIALIPIAAIPLVKTPFFISDYCLGASGKVRTVLLLSDVPLHKINTVLLDYQSRTSVNLIKILANKHWNISPKWINAERGFENEIKDKVAGVVIGDRAFSLKQKYKYVFDLSDEWFKMTSLPFVFATWVANKPINKEFVVNFNNALQFGLENLKKVVDEFHLNFPDSPINLQEYLTKYIDFELDEQKKASMKLPYDSVANIKI